MWVPLLLRGRRSPGEGTHSSPVAGLAATVDRQLGELPGPLARLQRLLPDHRLIGDNYRAAVSFNVYWTALHNRLYAASRFV